MTINNANVIGQDFVATAATSVNLPKTGQTTSYAAGDDGSLQRGAAWPSPRFTDNGNGTVTDNLTGLMWTKDANAPGPAACTPATTKTWQDALNYVACLNTNSYLGYTDWRLPNRKELRSLTNYGQANTATWLNTQGFSNVQVYGYWSSSTYAIGPTNGWFVIMDVGIVGANFKTISYAYYVWPVRAGGGAPADLPKTGQTTCYNAAGGVINCAGTGQDGELQKGVAWPNPRFTVDGTGLCVTDNLTGLMWVRTPDSTTRTWGTALTYANGLSLCGYDDWRLPNVNELESLINAEQANTATWLNTQGFSNVQDYDYWSSSTYAVIPTYGWFVGMGDGYVYFDVKTFNHYVWPVRAGQ